MSVRSTAFVLLLLSTSAVHAGWNGWGRDDWGWRPPTCHWCITGVEIAAYKAKGDTEWGSVQLTEGGNTEKYTLKSEDEGYGGRLRIGFGPRIIADLEHNVVDHEWDREDFSASFDTDRTRAGLGMFWYTTNGFGSYIRGGLRRVSTDINLNIAAAEVETTDPATGAGTGVFVTPADMQGNSMRFTRKEDVLLGGSVGALWTKSGMSFELEAGQYREGDLAFTELRSRVSISWNPKLRLYGHIERLIEDRGQGYTYATNAITEESRTISALLDAESSHTRMGFGLQMTF